MQIYFVLALDTFWPGMLVILLMGIVVYNKYFKTKKKKKKEKKKEKKKRHDPNLVSDVGLDFVNLRKYNTLS